MKSFRLQKIMVMALAVTALALPAFAHAANPAACFQSVQSGRGHALDKKAVLDGLDLSGYQKRGLQSWLLEYPWTNRPSGQFSAGINPVTIDGLGLTSSQITEIWSRIHAQEAGMNLDQPPGWPCEPFTNTAHVVAVARQALVYNGFRPNATFTVRNPRQIIVAAIRDGIEYTGAIVKSGPREIAMQINEVPTIGHSTGPGSVLRFAVGFNA